MKHTPGPWHVDAYRDGYYKIIDAQDQLDSDEHELPENELIGIDEANARLIAAAPEMLEVLIACENLLTELAHDGAENPELTLIREIIAKAKG